MEEITFYQNISNVFKTIFSSPLFIKILLLTAVLLLVMLFFALFKSKFSKQISVSIFAITILLLTLSNIGFFISTIDKVIENYIKIIYFPSCYVYMVLLTITDISMFIILYKDISKKSKIYIILNLLYFFIYQYLLFVIIRLVVANDIDIFERTQLYSNVQLTSLLQLSSYLFWIRVGVILVITLINKLNGAENKVDKKEITSKPRVLPKKDEENKKQRKFDKKVIKKDDVKYNDDSNVLLKKLLGEDYKTDNNDASTQSKENIQNRINKNEDQKKDNKKEYFYDDFFE